MSWVTIGDPGNVDTTGTSSTGLGSVAYDYRLAQFEVTTGQYCVFLNAVARSDPFGLYNVSMGTNANVAGIARTGTSGAFAYKILENRGNSANRPITYVSWFDAARYVNWLVSGSTETGAYALNGATSGPVPLRSSTASFFIPNANEWYKAAYYSPTLNTGTAGYWSYATQSNVPPGNQLGPLLIPNQANVKVNGLYCVTQSPGPMPGENYLSDVGCFNSSFYGAYDQTGSVWEWTETGTSASQRLRGGSWKDDAATCSSANTANALASTENDKYGFRVASTTLAREWSGSIVIDVPSGVTWTQSDAGYSLLSGDRPVIKIGGGTLILDQPNSLVGSFTIQEGATKLANPGALASSRVVLLGGGTMAMAFGLQTAELGGLDLSAGGSVDIAGGKLTSALLSDSEVIDAIREARIVNPIAPERIGWCHVDGRTVIGYAEPGDTNLDWIIDIVDISNLIAGGRYASSAVWCEGDFDHDGAFDVLDVSLFTASGLFGQDPYHPTMASVAAVPEPRIIGWIGAIVLPMLLAWRCHCWPAKA